MHELVRRSAVRGMRSALRFRLTCARYSRSDEQIHYVSSVVPNFSQVAAALSVTLELLSLAPRTFLPAFAKEGVLSCIQSQIPQNFSFAEAGICPPQTAFRCSSSGYPHSALFVSTSPHRARRKTATVPSSPSTASPGCSPGKPFLSSSPGLRGGSAKKENDTPLSGSSNTTTTTPYTAKERKGSEQASPSLQEGAKAAALPLSPSNEFLEASVLDSFQGSFRWFFAFSSSGHVVVHLSRFCIWLACCVLSIQAGASQASPRALQGLGSTCSTGYVEEVQGGEYPGERTSGSADVSATTESAGDKEESKGSYLSLVETSAVLPRLQLVTALLQSVEGAAGDDPEVKRERDNDDGQAQDSSRLAEMDVPMSGIPLEGAETHPPGAGKAGIEQLPNNTPEKGFLQDDSPGLGTLRQGWRALISLRQLLEGEDQISAFEFIESDVAPALASFLGGLDIFSGCPSLLPRQVAVLGSSSDFQVKSPDLRTSSPVTSAPSHSQWRGSGEEEGDRVSEFETATEQLPAHHYPFPDRGSGKRVAETRFLHEGVEGEGLFFPCGCPACRWERGVGRQFFMVYREELHRRVCLFLRALAFPSVSEDFRSSLFRSGEAGGMKKGGREYGPGDAFLLKDTSGSPGMEQAPCARDEEVAPRRGEVDVSGDETPGVESKESATGLGKMSKCTRPAAKNSAELSEGRDGGSDGHAAIDFWDNIPWAEADGQLLLQLVSLCMKGLSRTADKCFPVGPLFSSSSVGSSGFSSSLPPHLRPPHPSLAGVVLFHPGRYGGAAHVGSGDGVPDRSLLPRGEGGERKSAEFFCAASCPVASSSGRAVPDGARGTSAREGEEKSREAGAEKAEAATASRKGEETTESTEGGQGAAREPISSLSQVDEPPTCGNFASSESGQGQEAGDSVRGSLQQSKVRLDEGGRLVETEDGRKGSLSASGTLSGSRRVQRHAGRGGHETRVVGSAEGAATDFPVSEQSLHRRLPCVSAALGSSPYSICFSSHLAGVPQARRTSDVDPLSVFPSLHREVLVRLQPTSAQRAATALVGGGVSSQGGQDGVPRAEKTQERDESDTVGCKKVQADAGEVSLAGREQKTAERKKTQDETFEGCEDAGGPKKEDGGTLKKQEGAAKDSLARRREEGSQEKDSSSGDCKRVRRGRERGSKERPCIKADGGTGLRGILKSERSPSPASRAETEGEKRRKGGTDTTRPSDRSAQAVGDTSSIRGCSRGSRRRGRERTNGEDTGENNAQKNAAGGRGNKQSGGRKKDETTPQRHGEQSEEDSASRKETWTGRTGGTMEAEQKQTAEDVPSSRKQEETSGDSGAAARASEQDLSASSAPHGRARFPSGGSNRGTTPLSAFMRQLLSRESLEEGERDVELASASDMLSLLAGSAAAALEEDDEDEEEIEGEEDEEDDNGFEEEEHFSCGSRHSSGPSAVTAFASATGANSSAPDSVPQREQRYPRFGGGTSLGGRCANPGVSPPVAQTPAISSVSSSSFSSPRARHTREQSRFLNSSSPNTLDRVVAGLREQSQRLLHQSSAGHDSQALFDLLDRLSSSFLSHASSVRGVRARGSRGRLDGTRSSAGDGNSGEGGGGAPVGTGHMSRGAWMASLFPSFSSRFYRSGGGAGSRSLHDGPEFDVMVDGQTQMAKLEACVMRREVAKSSSPHSAHVPKGRRAVAEKTEEEQEAARETKRTQGKVAEKNSAGMRRGEDGAERQNVTGAADEHAEFKPKKREQDDNKLAEKRAASARHEGKQDKQAEDEKRSDWRPEQSCDEARMLGVHVAKKEEKTRAADESQGGRGKGRERKEKDCNRRRRKKQGIHKTMAGEEEKKQAKDDQTQRSTDDLEGREKRNRRHAGEEKRVQARQDGNRRASLDGIAFIEETGEAFCRFAWARACLSFALDITRRTVLHGGFRTLISPPCAA